MKIITIGVSKGGTGKTTTAAALAQAAVKDGKKVLAIDLDPQGNLSYSLGADVNKIGAFELLEGESIHNTIQRTALNMDVIASSPNLAAITTRTGSAKRLQKALAPLEDYDFVFVDTPPLMGELNYNALQAATGLIIPLEPDNSSLQGFYQIKDVSEHIRKSNPALEILGIILTRYDSRPNVNRFMKDEIERIGNESNVPLLAVIRPGIAVREALSMRKSLFEYAPKAKPTEDYWKLYTIIKK